MAEPADCVRAFVFSANLAAQEATGDTAASTSPDRVLNRLKGSSESRTLLFAVVEGRAPLGEVDELGVPLIASTSTGTGAGTGIGPNLDYAGFIHISLPLLEEKDIAEIECVFGMDYLPMPGVPLEPEERELADWMGATALDLTRRLGRTVAQVGVLHPDGTPDDYDPMAATYRALGFTSRFTEHQLLIPVPDNPPTPLLPHGVRAHVWPDYDIEEQFVDQVLDLLSVASADSFFGQLTVEPIRWTRARLADAHARLRDRRAHTLLVGLVSEGQVLALSEFSRQEHGDPEVAEWTLTVTHRDRRREGLAWAAKLSALRACVDHWPAVARTYTSVAAADAPMVTLSTRLGARTLSTSSAWELRL
ncbi:GNAT family acetyltransferase [uncultured Corynebacterium sp.]|uniref:GNAT family acetyltransferase n=1 Tax=uncultured Corynebacterium sp. TaxID=159447 RepID=UPI0025F70A30|nr:GNAT family acetyltransferase [uncultured Corynebacterium sp.]